MNFVRVYWNAIQIAATAWRLLGISHAEKSQDLFSKSTNVKHREDNFPAWPFEMLFKETSLDPNDTVSPEKHLFSTWSCKPAETW